LAICYFCSGSNPTDFSVTIKSLFWAFLFPKSFALCTPPVVAGRILYSFSSRPKISLFRWFQAFVFHELFFGLDIPLSFFPPLSLPYVGVVKALSTPPLFLFLKPFPKTWEEASVETCFPFKTLFFSILKSPLSPFLEGAVLLFGPFLGKPPLTIRPPKFPFPVHTLRSATPTCPLPPHLQGCSCKVSFGGPNGFSRPIAFPFWYIWPDLFPARPWFTLRPRLSSENERSGALPLAPLVPAATSTFKDRSAKQTAGLLYP